MTVEVAELPWSMTRSPGISESAKVGALIVTASVVVAVRLPEVPVMVKL